LKAVIPGGSSSKILRCDETFKIGRGDDAKDLTFWQLPLDFDTLAAAGSMAGSGGVIVMDDSRRISWVLNNITHFYAHESCGQCTPCREGSTWMKKVSDRIEEGKATPDDVKTLEEIAYQIDGKTVCAFGEASAWPVEAMIDKYRDELLAETSADNDYKSSERLEQEKFLAAVR
jgi:NADH-quinone oxidoreductase subunit F